jgi:hypothetical protein
MLTKGGGWSNPGKRMRYYALVGEVDRLVGFEVMPEELVRDNEPPDPGPPTDQIHEGDERTRRCGGCGRKFYQQSFRERPWSQFPGLVLKLCWWCRDAQEKGKKGR